MRLASPWKVPTHMPRVLIGSIAAMRVSISFAALLVNVTAMRPAGLTCPVCMSQATRVVSTRVLPLPAPARISADWWESVTASSCCSLRPERKSMIGGVPADYKLNGTRCAGSPGGVGYELWALSCKSENSSSYLTARSSRLMAGTLFSDGCVGKSECLHLLRHRLRVTLAREPGDVHPVFRACPALHGSHRSRISRPAQHIA